MERRPSSLSRDFAAWVDALLMSRRRHELAPYTKCRYLGVSVKRRPCRDVDISASLGISLAAARNLLKNLEGKNIIIAKMSEEERFYSYR